MFLRQVILFKGEKTQALKWDHGVKIYVKNPSELIQVMKIKINDKAQQPWESFLEQMGLYYKKTAYTEKTLYMACRCAD